MAVETKETRGLGPAWPWRASKHLNTCLDDTSGCFCSKSWNLFEHRWKICRNFAFLRLFHIDVSNVWISFTFRYHCHYIWLICITNVTVITPECAAHVRSLVTPESYDWCWWLILLLYQQKVSVKEKMQTIHNVGVPSRVKTYAQHMKKNTLIRCFEIGHKIILAW